ncbi:hypothetical protein JTB14_004006 [Gonioctena quinquepunctata]|nr:hypothetical protein JTB14_004006 [Gonioctena quinquepunctata]
MFINTSDDMEFLILTDSLSSLRVGINSMNQKLKPKKLSSLGIPGNKEADSETVTQAVITDIRNTIKESLETAWQEK